ncbi:hypothetical protein [Thalassoglobus polymorphus]|uniref:Uncharacterized protein n=1 Tax=Thalassoglobus polymorphus TaxID=2527994 RepID=A0A517QLK3_9PLAN|nr:hypothetical protein [Thalassoglobus polymorphus]QDT32522.1 hypothetical protein Mal48_17690 [Thalassoglobus polymorphus]
MPVLPVKNTSVTSPIARLVVIGNFSCDTRPALAWHWHSAGAGAGAGGTRQGELLGSTADLKLNHVSQSAIE